MGQDDTSNVDLAHDALNRMARAERRGTGCYLTAEMIECLGRTKIGAYWHEPDPRRSGSSRSSDGEKP